jgi:aspartate aminotransferase
MESSSIIEERKLILSQMAETLTASEIIKLASEVKQLTDKGERIHNLTIGDFNPALFPIPEELEHEIIEAYKAGHTNYPAANGIVELRKAVSKFLTSNEGLEYHADQILIAAGSRPLIYATYRTILDRGDKVIFPVPSWNNNHYCHLTDTEKIIVETKAENNFMPSAKDLAPFVKDAKLIALCSPLNPTGTVFTPEGLAEICDLILEENSRRPADEKPLYLMYDQIYWALTYEGTQHVNPVLLRPDMRNYTICIDGISKSFASTGLRVGWAFGTEKIINKMKAILSHVGAWSPKAEQVATAKFLEQTEAVNTYLISIREQLNERLKAIYQGIQELKKEGYKVDAIAPQAAIYLTVKFDLQNCKTKDGVMLHSTEDITRFLLNEAKLAIVPFYAFGASKESKWYRLSVGTISLKDINALFFDLRAALSKLTNN